ncbi:hypothetical protein [Rhizobium sp. R339]|uniref:hypothetical protein n=1 Tax=Rhizobium sp. R339 TaxID=1764273 RepID=UPI00167C6CFD|nr:hypothetical protein [Rhizobium sp. R339]
MQDAADTMIGSSNNRFVAPFSRLVGILAAREAPTVAAVIWMDPAYGVEGSDW